MAYELKGIGYMRKKLELKRIRVLLRYQHYEMKRFAADFEISTPPNLRGWKSTLGWCGKAVDSLADRLQFREFRDDFADLNGIYGMNNPDTLFDSAVLSALIASCCFVYISPDTDGFPRLQIIDGGNATGYIDPITGLLNEGYAVLERTDAGVPKLEAYFTPSQTAYYASAKSAPYRVDPHRVGWPLLVPIVYRPDAIRPFGHSRISRACMSLAGSAMRTVKRSEISAEFYSFPQKWVVGLSNNAEELNSWRASMSSMLSFGKDEDSGDSPTVGQFQQQSMVPHTEQLRMFASLFAGETGLTLDDLGFPSDNPSSSEAIKAAHETMRLTARKAQRSFGSGFLNAGYLAACLRDDYPYERQQFRATRPIWEPVFEPDAATLSQVGDAAIKINQAIPGFFGRDNLQDISGIRPDGGV